MVALGVVKGRNGQSKNFVLNNRVCRNTFIPVHYKLSLIGDRQYFFSAGLPKSARSADAADHATAAVNNIKNKKNQPFVCLKVLEIKV